MPSDELSPAAVNFLRLACKYVQEYDEEGTAVVPVTAWPRLLADLEVEANSGAADFLAGFMQGAGEGRVSYLPLLEALGFALPDEVEHRAAHGPSPGPPSELRPRQRSEVAPESCEGPDGGRRRGDAEYSEDRSQAPSSPGRSSAAGGAARSPNGDGSWPCGGGVASSTASATPREDFGDGCSEFDEDVESFWARRAGAIQRLFHLWDCNQLTNESFTARLQDVLGERVDVTSEDSAFQKLANKHKTARNLKFASLSSALRQDAKTTLRRRLGYPADGASSYCGSASVYEASEVGSEAPSLASGSASELAARGLAAGRPTRSRPASSLGSAGRRHFEPAASQLPLATAGADSRREPVPEEARGAYRGRDDDSISVASAGSYRHGGAGAANGYPDIGNDQYGRNYAGGYGDNGGYSGSNAGGRQAREAQPPMAPLAPERPHEDESARPQVPLDDDFWSRTDPSSAAAAIARGRAVGGVGSRPQHADQSDAMSMSDLGSEADSHRSAFSHRNRTGHGNILSWGNDSRNITPERKRGGKQLTVDEKLGVPRSQVTNGIFPQMR
eukprot:TRINITY_DN14952_c0_g5_i1.p1 TRINITY_DN14952_c0_g5~~TRINITY_DN14952_c0_g5_i1.p1  ORF type:complete len:560 (-),score=123.49 TRINITY_DN14952_c0_g5_i1:293-1972(-)